MASVLARNLKDIRYPGIGYDCCEHRSLVAFASDEMERNNLKRLGVIVSGTTASDITDQAPAGTCMSAVAQEPLEPHCETLATRTGRQKQGLRWTRMLKKLYRSTISSSGFSGEDSDFIASVQQSDMPLAHSHLHRYSSLPVVASRAPLASLCHRRWAAYGDAKWKVVEEDTQCHRQAWRLALVWTGSTVELRAGDADALKSVHVPAGFTNYVATKRGR